MLPVLKWTSIVGLVGALLMAATFVVLYNSIDIPNENEGFLDETSFVYYADGKAELGSFATQNRDSIPLPEIPDTIEDAVVAAEDRSFWSNNGIDARGILRAAFSNVRGNSTQGASTITQQYVKILYLTQERSLTRKVKEAILSLKVQRTFSKSEVLEGYLNTIYFGRGAYGVEAAAKAFFDKPATELDLRESAVLASVLNNPTKYDPANGKQAKSDLRERYRSILAAMVETGAVAAEDSEQAAKRLPKFFESDDVSAFGGQRGHMLDMVRDELLRLDFTEEQINGGGLRVTTTFTPEAMEAAKAGVLEFRPEGLSDKQLHVGAATVDTATGAVRGFYGGQDYLQSQLNWAVEGGQAGSTFKPFALAAAITQGFSLRDTFDGNSPYELPDGTDVENQGDESYGSAISMVEATENSVNTAFIDMTIGMDDGPEAIVEMANAMGIPPMEAGKQRGFPNVSAGLEPVTGVALGSQTVSPINMANGYATIANAGVPHEPFIIEKVVGPDGETAYEHKVKDGKRAITADIAADVSYALQQVVSAGSGTAALDLGRPAAGKTGTATNDDGDVTSAWFTGYTPQLSTSVVYVRGKGNEQLKDWLPASSDGREGYFGGNYPAKTWTAIMQRALEGLPEEDFPEPAYVDGEAPSDGYEPYVAPPPPPPPPDNGGNNGGQPSPEVPTDEPTEEPTEPSEEPTTQAPTPTPPPPPPPTQSGCGILGCPDPTPTPTPTPPPSGDPTPTGTPPVQPRPARRN
ncbi:MAG: transglycosylase domain-containing protein [Nocardioides sp.]